MRLRGMERTSGKPTGGTFAILSVAAIALGFVLILAAARNASAQEFSFGRPGSNATIYLRPGSIVTAPDTLEPRFGPLRPPHSNPIGHPMVIDIPAPQPILLAPNALELPTVYAPRF